MHDLKEAEIALKYDQALIGINNRNLKNLDVSINNTISIFEVVKAHKGPYYLKVELRMRMTQNIFTKKQVLKTFLLENHFLNLTNLVN